MSELRQQIVQIGGLMLYQFIDPEMGVGGSDVFVYGDEE